MCVVSYVGDYWRDTFPQRHPTIAPMWIGGTTNIPVTIGPNVTREEFEALRRDVLELKELLKAAKKFDEATGQPDCETDSKVALIKKLAELVGVDMGEIFK